MNKKPKRSPRKRSDPDDVPEITQEWVDGASLYHGRKLIRRGGGGFVAQLARMPNVGEDRDFARERTDRRSSENESAALDAANYLDNEGVILAYLTAALQNPDSEAFMMALSNVAKARDIAKIANATGLGHRVLEKVLAPGTKPSFESVHKVVNALGVRWAVVPQASSRVTEVRERLARRPAMTTRVTAAEALRRERSRR